VLEEDLGTFWYKHLLGSGNGKEAVVAGSQNEFEIWGLYGYPICQRMDGFEANCGNKEVPNRTLSYYSFSAAIVTYQGKRSKGPWKVGMQRLLLRKHFAS